MRGVSDLANLIAEGNVFAGEDVEVCWYLSVLHVSSACSTRDSCISTLKVEFRGLDQRRQGKKNWTPLDPLRRGYSMLYRI